MESLEHLDERALLERRISRAGFVKATGALALAGALGTAPVAFGSRVATIKGKRIGELIIVQAPFFNEFNSWMKKEFTPAGVGLTISSAEGSAVKGQNIVETFIAQKFDGIIIITSPVTGFDSLVRRAKKQGICVINHSAGSIGGVDQNVSVAHGLAGAGIGKVAAQWANTKAGGKVRLGILTNLEDPDQKRRTDGAIAELKKRVRDVEVVQTAQGQSAEQGAAGSANMLQAHPEINMILTHNTVGGAGAFTAATEAGKNNPDTFFLGSVDIEDAVLERIAKGGIYQVGWSFFFSYSSRLLGLDMMRCLRGEPINPTRLLIGRPITRAGVPEYRSLISHPRRAANQKYYKDPNVMRYSKIRLRTGQNAEEAVVKG